MVEFLEWCLAFSYRTRIPEILFGAAFPGVHAAMIRRPRWYLSLAVFSSAVNFIHLEWIAPWQGLSDRDIEELKHRFGEGPSRHDVMAYKHTRLRPDSS